MSDLLRRFAFIFLALIVVNGTVVTLPQNSCWAAGGVERDGAAEDEEDEAEAEAEAEAEDNEGHGAGCCANCLYYGNPLTWMKGASSGLSAAKKAADFFGITFWGCCDCCCQWLVAGTVFVGAPYLILSWLLSRGELPELVHKDL